MGCEDPMPLLTLSHVTRYTYRHSVSFGEHRIMVRPRESYDQHLIDAELHITPEPSGLRWLQDVFGNSVAIATFDQHAKELVFDSRVRLLHEPAELQDVDIEDYARFYPFTYSSEEMPDLLRSIERQHHDPLRQIDTWARRFVAKDGRTDTLDMLSAMTAAIKREFTYVARAEKGTQTPIETLAKAQGHVSRLCDAYDRGGSRIGFRGAVRVGIRLQPVVARTPCRRRQHACLGPGLSPRLRVGGIRSDQRHRRQSRADPRRDRT